MPFGRSAPAKRRGDASQVAKVHEGIGRYDQVEGLAVTSNSAFSLPIRREMKSGPPGRFVRRDYLRVFSSCILLRPLIEVLKVSSSWVRIA